MSYVNLTPHTINLTSGESFAPSGKVARVQASFSGFDARLVCRQEFGEVQDLPPSDGESIFIVSGMVLSALNGTRADVVAPATGHPLVSRNEKGHIIAVPGFVQ